MSNATLALIFVMVVNVLMWFSQLAMIDVAAGDSTIYYHCEGTILETFGECQNYTISSSPENNLPGAGGTIGLSTGNIFTDIFNNILSWIKSVPGVNYLVAMVSAPYNILKAIGLPSEVAFGLGVLWYGITTFIVVAFLWGRE